MLPSCIDSPIFTSSTVTKTKSSNREPAQPRGMYCTVPLQPFCFRAPAKLQYVGTVPYCTPLYYTVVSILVGRTTFNLELFETSAHEPFDRFFGVYKILPRREQHGQVSYDEPKSSLGSALRYLGHFAFRSQWHYYTKSEAISQAPRPVEQFFVTKIPPFNRALPSSDIIPQLATKIHP